MELAGALDAIEEQLTQGAELLLLGTCNEAIYDSIVRGALATLPTPAGYKLVIPAYNYLLYIIMTHVHVYYMYMYRSCAGGLRNHGMAAPAASQTLRNRGRTSDPCFLNARV